MSENRNNTLSPSLAPLITRIHEEKPLLHHITNMVVMNDTANISLAIGALPVMAHAIEEVEEMVGIARALVLNIGTLTPSQIEAMLLAGKRANERNIPVVMDPVGAGATRLRTESALKILKEVKISILRGNASEIGALVGVSGETRGVESISISEEKSLVAQKAARKFGCVVVITGEQDIITDGTRLARVHNGLPILATITGTGCMTTTLVGAFAAIEPDAWVAATAALTAMGLAGEMAAPLSSGPGTFRSNLLDSVSQLDEAIIDQKQKVTFEYV